MTSFDGLREPHFKRQLKQGPFTNKGKGFLLITEGFFISVYPTTESKFQLVMSPNYLANLLKHILRSASFAYRLMLMIHLHTDFYSISSGGS